MHLTSGGEPSSRANTRAARPEQLSLPCLTTVATLVGPHRAKDGAASRGSTPQSHRLICLTTGLALNRLIVVPVQLQVGLKLRVQILPGTGSRHEQAEGAILRYGASGRIEHRAYPKQRSDNALAAGSVRDLKAGAILMMRERAGCPSWGTNPGGSWTQGQSATVSSHVLGAFCDGVAVMLPPPRSHEGSFEMARRWTQP